MRSENLLIAGLLVGIFLARPIAASVDERTDFRVEAVPDSKTESGMLRATIMPAVERGEDVLFADVTFEAPLEVGTEIELWPDLGGEKWPWDSPSLRHERRSWIVDRNSGQLVRFDVTEFVQAAIRARLPLKLLVRLTPDVSAATDETVGAINWRLELHRSAHD